MRDDVRRFAARLGIDARESGASAPWWESHRLIGIRFPSDYRDLLDAVGPGSVRGDLAIISPWPMGESSYRSGGFHVFAEYTAGQVGPAFVEMRSESPDLCPYAVYPEAGGILAWASNQNGDHCFWLTEGENPDTWPIVVWDRGRFPDDPWRRYDPGIVPFLMGVMFGEDDELADLAYPSPEVPPWVPGI
ncbi:SMI1/KNR4 family protein [Streptacidiphilus cavernicola]|uniref:SMI1/KNR4 family protein n=1 Tax=Streptacidiphilus cavernicola TaxID=3342716 RepID=A0ABV6W5I9_9ACTN